MCSQYMPIYDERSVHELLHFNVLLSVPNSVPNSVPDNRILCRD